MINRNSNMAAVDFVNRVGLHLAPTQWQVQRPPLNFDEIKIAIADGSYVIGDITMHLLYDQQDDYSVRLDGVILESERFSRAALACIEHAVALLMDCRYDPA